GEMLPPHAGTVRSMILTETARVLRFGAPRCHDHGRFRRARGPRGVGVHPLSPLPRRTTTAPAARSAAGAAPFAHTPGHRRAPGLPSAPLPVSGRGRAHGCGRPVDRSGDVVGGTGLDRLDQAADL